MYNFTSKDSSEVYFWTFLKQNCRLYSFGGCSNIPYEYFRVTSGFSVSLYLMKQTTESWLTIAAVDDEMVAYRSADDERSAGGGGPPSAIG